MRLTRGLLAALLLVSATSAGDITPVTGEPIKAEIIRVTDKDVTFKQSDKTVTKPLKEILKLDYREVGKLPANKAYALVELTDGTQLYTDKLLLKKRDFELTLLSGPKLELPAEVVANVLFDATSEESRRDWKSRVFNMRGKDVVVVKRKVKDKEKEYEIASNLEATIGEGDEAGTAIHFAVTIGGMTTEAKRAFSTLRGLIFKHTLGAKAAPFNCKLLDTTQNLVMVSSVSPRDGGLVVTTPSGAKIDYGNEQIARIDYTQGRLEYLSDLTPTKMVVRSNLDDDEANPDQWHVFKDSNLDKRPIAIGGTTYPKGLALKPYAELVYDLKGEYRELEAVVGLDDAVSAAGASTLVVEIDGKELASVTISSDDKVRHKPLKLNVKDARMLRIVVKSDGEFDTARHLELADAKVRKEDK